MPEKSNNASITSEYIGDGIYRHYCSGCKSSIDIYSLRISDYTTSEGLSGIEFVEKYPVQFCWNCGIRFNKITPV